MASKFRQDMPPAGGYGPIQWARTFKQKRFGGYAVFGIFIGVSAAAMISNHIEKKRRRCELVEMIDGRTALEPLVMAERQRMFLRRLRQNRDEENELMKDVPGWEAGTLYGDPVYHNLSDRFHIVNQQEYFIHQPWHDMYDRMFDKRKH